MGMDVNNGNMCIRGDAVLPYNCRLKSDNIPISALYNLTIFKVYPQVIFWPEHSVIISVSIVNSISNGPQC